jgi:beta-lactamase class C
MADDLTKLRTVIDELVRPVMVEHSIPGMSIAITARGQPVFLSYGFASKEENTPVSQATLFEIGSISKTFTATLACYAQAEGKLSMQDHPGKYLPQLKGSGIDKARLLHLGTYTAGGLPLQFPDGISNDQMIGYFQKWKPEAPAGKLREYSNPSSGLFGHITALALKTEFTDAIENQLFSKLGMRQSFVRVPERELANYAWGYNKANEPVRVNPGVLDAEAYGVKSTAADMIRFVEANINPDRLGQSMQRAIQCTHTGYFAIGDMTQGLGWEQYPYPISVERLLSGNSAKIIFERNPAKQLTPFSAPSKSALYNKTGSTGGFGSYVAFVPAKRIGVVMLANKNFPIPVRIKLAHSILEQLSQQEKSHSQ